MIKAANIFFLGIGGIGMSALARWFKANHYHVAGYDRAATALTSQLQEEGINIHFEDEVKNIPAEYLDKENTLVVFTPAIPADCIELNYFRDNGFEVRKRSEVLGLITEKMPCIAIAGTHGKTTTSSMVAHLLTASGVDCAAFLGGITQNYQTNLLLNKTPEAWVVIEADEYDRSFLRLNPKIAVITTMDADHLDIYENEKEFIRTFNEFAGKITQGGSLIHREGLPVEHDGKGVTIESFGTSNASFTALDVRAESGWFVFDIQSPDGIVKDVRMQVPGLHNVMNALAAWGCGKKLGITEDKMKDALASFKGVKRRFEYIYKGEDVIYIDDYAHHPVEIEACLTAVRKLFPEKKVTAVFQPHLFSRTRDFMDDFAKSLSLSDQTILLDIYPAREKPIEGITSAKLLEKISLASKNLVSKEELPEILSNGDHEIIVTMGAGDIDKLIEPIKLKLKEVYEN